MLKFSEIELVYFKNHTQTKLSFSENIIGITGKNGIGKTNLLDAIYTLCFTKSYLHSDTLAAQHQKEGYRLVAKTVMNNDEQTIQLVYKIGQKKTIAVNNIYYDKLQEHIGKFSSVFITPDDINLITGGSAERRKYIDAIACQNDALYLQYLIQYNQLLKDKNGLLKQKKFDDKILEIYNEQMSKPAQYIFEQRKNLLLQLIPLISENYKNLAGKTDEINIKYRSQLFDKDFITLQNEYAQKDFILQRSNAGIHKDDLDIMMSENPLKYIASQGQKKTILFAMKAAEHQFIHQFKGVAPVFLLDDVFEKLDGERLQNLLKLLTEKKQAQIFITDTDENRLKNCFESLQLPYQIIKLD